MTTPTTWQQLSPNSPPAAKTNPPVTGATTVIRRPAPRFHDIGDPDAYVTALAAAVAAEHPQPAVDFHNPRLTRGQAQVLRTERDRLCRMLDRRDGRSLGAVLVLLEDLAEQAPAVDQALAEQDERRRAALAGRTRLAHVLTRRADS